LSLVSSIGFLLLAIVAVVALLVAAQRASRSFDAIAPDARAIVLCNEIDRLLQQHEALQALGNGEDIEHIEASIANTVSTLLTEMREHIGSEYERDVLDGLSADVAAYFAGHRAAEHASDTRAEVLQTLRPLADRVLASSARLRSINEDDLRRSEAMARASLHVATAVALAAVAAFAAGLLLLALSTRLLITTPIASAVRAMRAFRRGDGVLPLNDGPLREVQELTSGFSEMATSIARQRHDQLSFLAAVAHDLRDPLSAIKMLTRMLERDVGADGRDRLARLDAQINRLSRMVGDVLDAARIDAGEFVLVRADLDLREPVQSIVDLYAPTTSTHTLKLSVAAHPVIVNADRARVEQVVSNLISNAIKYSPAGDIEVSVVATDVDGACIAVTDHGIGIGPEDLERVFDPFRRTKQSAAMPGVGLGLSSVKKIVTAHGGRIDVTSSLGTGSTFTAWFPLAVAPSADMPSAQSGTSS
jgi:signal transduction histidine kinase